MRDYHQPCLVVDIDGTLCPTRPADLSYSALPVIGPVVETLRAYHQRGWYIILCTARQERTYEGNIGLRTKHTLPVLLDWLERQQIPYDELRIEKPWHGFAGFAVDDTTVPPSVFVNTSAERILQEWLPRHQVR